MSGPPDWRSPASRGRAPAEAPTAEMPPQRRPVSFFCAHRAACASCGPRSPRKSSTRKSWKSSTTSCQRACGAAASSPWPTCSCGRARARRPSCLRRRRRRPSRRDPNRHHRRCPNRLHPSCRHHRLSCLSMIRRRRGCCSSHCCRQTSSCQTCWCTPLRNRAPGSFLLLPS